jgi:hypothetical protein
MKMRLSSAFMIVFAYGLSLFSHLESCDCLSSRDNDCFIAQVGDNIYLNSEKIIIADNAFYIKVENNLLPISTLYSDSNGIYLNVKREKEREGWTCPVCHEYNNANQFPCWNSSRHWLYGSEHSN